VSRIINTTPHAVNIIDGPTFPNDGHTIRLTAKTVAAAPIVIGNTANPVTVPVTRSVFGEPVYLVDGQPEPLPQMRPGVFYIVSQIVKSAMPSRFDFLVPAEVVRDEAGNIVGCKSLGV
jgi:hypothetical protein